MHNCLKPAANKGKIHENTSETLDIEVENISGSQYADYVAASKEKGFTTDAKSTSYSYRAYNFDGYCLNLTYNDSSKSLSIKLQKPMEMSEISWPASNAGNQLPVPNLPSANFLTSMMTIFMCILVTRARRAITIM